MTWRHWFVRYAGLPLWDLATGRSVGRDFRFLQATLLWPREQVRAYQSKRLRALIRQAYEQVPFYRERMNERGLRPEDFQTPSDLPLLPPLTRADLQQHGPDLLARNGEWNHWTRSASSGSTGEPVLYYKDAAAESRGKAAIYLGWSLQGWRFGDRNVTLWGNPTTVHEDWARWGSRAKAWLFGNLKIAAFRLVEAAQLDRALEWIRAFQPDFIDGYTNTIYTLARRAQEQGWDLPRCRGVLTTAETLLGHQREVIEAALGPVYDGYGCGEINGIAFQCLEQSGYHIIEPHVIVEFEDLGLGEEKALLITDLDNCAMPLIRYRVGDLGVPSGEMACPCGCPFAQLQRISGRTTDLIQTRQGGYLLVPSFLGGKIFKEVRGVRQHQVVQCASGEIEIRLQVTEAFTPGDEAAIRRYVTSYLGTDEGFRIVLVEAIPTSATGKLKLLVRESKGPA